MTGEWLASVVASWGLGMGRQVCSREDGGGVGVEALGGGGWFQATVDRVAKTRREAGVQIDSCRRVNNGSVEGGYEGVKILILKTVIRILKV